MTRRNRSSRLETEPRRFVARALRALNVPNIITLIRLGLVPAMAYALVVPQEKDQDAKLAAIFGGFRAPDLEVQPSLAICHGPC